MSVDCLLFYGIKNSVPISQKQAGAYRIATEVRNNGFSVQVVDCSGLETRDPRWTKIIKKFVGKNTLWVGFSTTLIDDVLGVPQAGILDADPEPFRAKKDNNRIWINEFMELVREQNPNIRFIHGGAGAFDLRDYGWWKFSYGTDQEIVDFTKRLSNREIISDYNNRLIVSPGYKKFSTSSIIWTREDLVAEEEVLPVEVSRGCIFKCKFCSFPYKGKKNLDYIKEAATLREELERNYENWGTREYVFSDDTYNDSLDKIRFLYEEVFRKLSFQIGFTTYARLDLLERQGDEAVDILINSGLTSVLFGIESLNPLSARSVGKSGDSQKQLEFLQQIRSKKPDIFLGSGFIIGLPHDTRSYIEYFKDWLFREENPLDWWWVESLSINVPQRAIGREFYSDIDLDPEKYGYKVLSHTPTLWANRKNRYRLNWEINDINLEYCSSIEKEIIEQSYRSDRFFAGGFEYALMRNSGLSFDYIRKNPMSILRPIIYQNAQARSDKYYEDVLAL